MTDPIIRVLGRADAAQYRAARLRALEHAPTAFTSSFERERLREDAFFEERASFAADNFIVGAFAGTHLIGTAGGTVDLQPKRSHIGYIVGVWVDDAFRRRGIARQLTLRTMDQLSALPQITVMQLSVTANNRGALRLYESLGFKVWGEEPDALRFDGESYAELHLFRTVGASV